ncbi:MAG: lasso peptide biosynthesis B2 protein [Rhodoferax sp.]|nr:lasso peptide biosynthesis B2 protein [Rhodoferax sp.]
MAAIAWLPLFAGLRALGIETLFRAGYQLPANAQPGLTLMKLVCLSELVNRAARLPPIPATCLSRSLLSADAAAPGCCNPFAHCVSKNQYVFAAHAWVEYQGTPINDQPDVGDQFQPFHHHERIAGIIRFDGVPAEAGLVEGMTGAMAYRGPDGINHWCKGSVALTVHAAHHARIAGRVPATVQ